MVASTKRCVERRQGYHRIYDNLSTSCLPKTVFISSTSVRAADQTDSYLRTAEQWLAFLDSDVPTSRERAGFLLSAFSLKLLALVGYRPELTHCLGCRQTIAPGSYQWHGLKGGVVCTNCTLVDQETWFAARPMADDALKLVRFGLEEGFASHLRPHLTSDALAGFHEATESLMISHFPVIRQLIEAACAVLSRGLCING